MRLEQESYEDAGLASFIEENFVPLHVHIKENPKNFRRFDSFWTPTVLVLDPEGKERSRLEGYLPKDDFRAYLETGLARVALARKDWADAEARYAAIAEAHPESVYAPQAIYFRGVSKYSQSHDHHDLTKTAAELEERYPNTEWRSRSLPWDED